MSAAEGAAMSADPATSGARVFTAGEATAWRDETLARLRGGDRFAGLYGEATEEGCRLNAVLRRAGGFDLLSVEVVPDAAGELTYPALSAEVKPAFWYERAAHDLSGLVPLGHPRLDPLLLPLHPGSDRPRPGRGEPAADLRPVPDQHGPVDVTGRGMFALPYGPVRSGVFESIEFLIETPGEDIPHLTIRPHFKHRGVAKRFEGLGVRDGVLVAERVEGIASVAHALAFSHAIESVAEVTVPPRARLIRVIHAELERVANHLDVAMRLADAAGLAVATSRFAWHKEAVMRLVSRMCGSRFGRGVVIPGGVSGEPRIAPDDALAELARIARRIEDDAGMLMRTASFLDRLRGTGRLDSAYAREWALLGPIGRASAGTEDVRWTHPTDAYPELELPEEPAREEEGDALARTRVRWSEVTTSLALTGRAVGALRSAADESLMTTIRLPDGDAFGLGWAEAPQGEALHAVSLRDGGIVRCFARSASLHDLVAFHDAFHTDIFTDFAFIEASFGLGYAGVAM